MQTIYIVVFIVIVLFISIFLDEFLNKKKKTKKGGRTNEKQEERDKLAFNFSSEFNGRLKENIKKREDDGDIFRKMYNLSSSAKLYYDLYDYDRIISSTNMKLTTHECKIADLIIRNRFFDYRCIFLDSYFKTRNGRYAQIDIIAVNKKGVFVIESKDYNGWIFGNGNQQTWTQNYYRDKYRFYNPIRQNYSHIQCLKEKLNKSGVNYFSIIVFGDDAEFKDISSVPKNTFLATTYKIREMMVDIMKKEKDVLSAEEIIEVCRLINQNKIEPTDEIRNEHIEKIKDTTGESRVYS